MALLHVDFSRVFNCISYILFWFSVHSNLGFSSIGPLAMETTTLSHVSVRELTVAISIHYLSIIYQTVHPRTATAIIFFVSPKPELKLAPPRLCIVLAGVISSPAPPHVYPAAVALLQRSHRLSNPSSLLSTPCFFVYVFLL